MKKLMQLHYLSFVAVLLNAAGAVLVAAAIAVVAAGCEGEGSPTARTAPATAPSTATAAAPASRPAVADGRLRVAFLGDSLTAGYGLPAEEAFPALLGEHLGSAGLPIAVQNAGVSGDTTAGGLRRIDWVLGQKPDIVVVGLGGNDGLRALPPAASEENLRKIIQKCRDAGATPLLLGMLIPPNYGPDYITRFRDIYPRLAAELNVPLVPFLLEGVGGDPALNLPDGIHPTAEGHQRVARTVLPYLKPLVEQRSEARAK